MSDTAAAALAAVKEAAMRRAGGGDTQEDGGMFTEDEYGGEREMESQTEIELVIAENRSIVSVGSLGGHIDDAHAAAALAPLLEQTGLSARQFSGSVSDVIFYVY